MDPCPIFLIGFMAAGKSTVGPLLAERLGRRWVDLDERVEAAAGRRIPAIFDDEGEMGFRRREASALAEVTAERDVVVSCGGGAPAFGRNLALMNKAGVTCALLVALDEVLARVGAEASSRPLLSAGRAQAEKLFHERQEIYRAADISVETGGRTPQSIADELARRVRLRLGDVRLGLDGGGVPIHLAGGGGAAGELFEELLPGTRSAAVVTDENVAQAGHTARVVAALGGAGVHSVELVIPPGEPSKNLGEVERLAGACVREGLDRASAIVAVGGGVVGDLAGFLAAILYRGIACVQVPTTLLAMVDSAIGGKTGVDLPSGKNLIGAFWQPRFVLADVATLATLPPRERSAAFGEIVKYGLLGDAALFERLERDGAPDDVGDLVARCAAQKARVVAVDERERTGARATLNLGHTLGHAIELASGFRLLHGEAVALGLVAAAEVSERLGVAPAGLAARVAATVARVGLDADLSPWRRREVVALVGADKKRQGRRIAFQAIRSVGRVEAVDVTVDELDALLEVRA